jgi:hypothetical protein
VRTRTLLLPDTCPDPREPRTHTLAPVKPGNEPPTRPEQDPAGAASRRWDHVALGDHVAETKRSAQHRFAIGRAVIRFEPFSKRRRQRVQGTLARCSPSASRRQARARIADIGEIVLVCSRQRSSTPYSQ